MAQTIIVQLVDDIDGSPADETVSFSLDAKAYEIELSKKNAASLRRALIPYIDKARAAGKAPAPARSRGVTARRSGSAVSKTLFSGLSAEEKERFRAWANMPDARRIADARIKQWVEAGRP